MLARSRHHLKYTLAQTDGSQSPSHKANTRHVDMHFGSACRSIPEWRPRGGWVSGEGRGKGGSLRSGAGFLIIDPDGCRETPVNNADPSQLILREPRCQVKNDPLGGCEAASVECINSLLKALASALYIFEHLTPPLLTLCCWTQHCEQCSAKKRDKYTVQNPHHPMMKEICLISSV